MAPGVGTALRPKSPQVVWPLWCLGQGSFTHSLPSPPVCAFSECVSLKCYSGIFSIAIKGLIRPFVGERQG